MDGFKEGVYHFVCEPEPASKIDGVLERICLNVCFNLNTGKSRMVIKKGVSCRVSLFKKWIINGILGLLKNEILKKKFIYVMNWIKYIK